MANSNFVVQNGLQVGPTTIWAGNGAITSTSTSPSNLSSDINVTAGNITVSTDNTAQSFITNGSHSTNSTNGQSTPLSDAELVVSKNVNAFVQVVVHNPSNGPSASADFIAYSDLGDNLTGYIDMGIESSGYTNSGFIITNAGDAYILASAPVFASNSAAIGGNLVLATDQASAMNGIIKFSAGGFGASNAVIQAQIVPNDGLYVVGNLYSQMGVVYQGTNAPDTDNNNTLIGGLTTSVNNSSTSPITINHTLYQNFSNQTGPWAYSTDNGNAASIGNRVTSNYYFNGPDIYGFYPYGQIQIDSELINYTGVVYNTGNIQFTGIARAAGGTTAASHNSSAAVVQIYNGLTNASGVFTGNTTNFQQFALKNYGYGSGSSTDLIAYSANGDNLNGWIDLGITGGQFSASQYGITGPDDGYIFMSAPRGTTGNGSIFISTDSSGVQNDIVFTTGGFTTGHERMRITGTSRAGAPAGITVNIATTSTSTTTGAMRIAGGLGVQGNVNVGGNVFINGNISFGGSGTTVTTQNLAVQSPIVFVGNLNPGNSYDLGLVGSYYNGAGNVYTGFAKNHSTGYYQLFDGLTSQPSNTVNWAGTTPAGGSLGNLLVANSTSSSSTTTGALVVTGGTGIGGALFVGGTINATSTILPTANASVNIGSTSAWFNNIYGTSTHALYADLAENYQADKTYSAGTVLMFGGSAEVTVADADTTSVAGIVSTNPAHLMNGGLTGATVVPLALQGRVPCQIIGPVKKGDLMVSAGFGFAKASNNPAVGSVIGKALQDYPSTGKAVIEVVVGRV